ncbi:MAG: hypothetical protein K9H16_09155 [Bacteroidales bacterium]|nr:hypothetical protein [Bacteroidales bacterium]
MDFKEYYTAFGKLVYAISMADGSVQNEEANKVLNFVISQILDMEQTTGGTSDSLMAFNTEKEFNRLRKENASIKITFQQFIDFHEKNKNDFDEKMKTTCITLMEKVAIAHNGIEDSEQAMIEIVKKRFKEV